MKAVIPVDIRVLEMYEADRHAAKSVGQESPGELQCKFLG